MIKKVLIIYRVDRKEKNNIGVVNKLRGQVEGLQNCNLDVDYVIHDDKFIYLNENRIYKKRKTQIPSFFKVQFYNYLYDLPQYDLYIIRYGLSTPALINWLKKTKERHPKSKIVIDMPTYPYQKEWDGIKGKLVLAMDDYYKKHLSTFVEVVIHSGNEKEILSIPTFHMTNGVIVAPFRERTNYNSANHLQLIAIGKWQYWHGLDRLIEGISLSNEKVHLDIVGEGPGSQDLKSLIRRRKLENQIKWHGVLVGSALEMLIDQAHLGIGTLGIHRKGVFQDSSLKHRSYCASGLPFVLSTSDEDFPETLPFVFYVPEDDTFINISKLSSFAERMYTKENSNHMRQYAKEKMSWNSKMKKLIAYFEAT